MVWSVSEKRVTTYHTTIIGESYSHPFGIKIGDGSWYSDFYSVHIRFPGKEVFTVVHAIIWISVAANGCTTLFYHLKTNEVKQWKFATFEVVFFAAAKVGYSFMSYCFHVCSVVPRQTASEILYLQQKQDTQMRTKTNWMREHKTFSDLNYELRTKQEKLKHPDFLVLSPTVNKITKVLDICRWDDTQNCAVSLRKDKWEFTKKLQLGKSAFQVQGER